MTWKKEEETVFIQSGQDEERSEDDTDIDSPATAPPQRQHDVSKARTPLFVYVISFFSIIGGFLFGYDTGVIAGALLELEKDFRLDATKKELVVSVTVVAAAIGALCGGECKTWTLDSGLDSWTGLWTGFWTDIWTQVCMR